MSQSPNTANRNDYSRVPAVTIDFWIIKLLAVTMGETAADYLAVNLGLGLTATTLIMCAVLIAALVLQFSRKKYILWSYWLAVVLISIVGTLVTDNLVDNFGVSLVTTTVVFSLALIITFVLWYSSEKTLSIHYPIRHDDIDWQRQGTGIRRLTTPPRGGPMREQLSRMCTCSVS